ncbi:flagellar motor switch protein FliM [Proteiniborus ethanoligenes]|uniref:Flagellar motor switch protein FliM n=1 Tax=Proteiniborus ethanoligenes TaxID=415015 RepID=A0A1H3PP04_9FIRM|nr:flagellar motor switch protein FliM [Proteiniborus ethanoligenes]TAH63134.1 MAG: flagellar motor switch protein FliM [Gottschalkiaceae bacterium]SDZ02962.1 flagellar motor switch protein FliM [Proteiniborus ethanoligenes]
MAEVLSQHEIDALLNALNSGEVDVKEIKDDSNEKKVKKYDFRNPQKIAKDQLRTLEIIHDNFSRLLQTFLSGYLRAPVKISVLTVDQYVYSEFTNAISNPAFLSIVNFEPLNGQIIIDISSNIAFTIIDRLLGGDGENLVDIRSFTEIELTLLKNVMQRTMDLIAEAWENVIILTPSLDKIETNSQFAQIISPNETIALVTMNLSIGNIEGLINLCIPHIVIEPILERLSTKLWFSTTTKDITEIDKELLRKRIKNTVVSLNANLSSTKITLGDLINLQTGDVIMLDNVIEDEVYINVGTQLKFFGKPGANKNKVAVQITRVQRDGDEIND